MDGTLFVRVRRKEPGSKDADDVTYVVPGYHASDAEIAIPAQVDCGILQSVDFKTRWICSNIVVIKDGCFYGVYSLVKYDPHGVGRHVAIVDDAGAQAVMPSNEYLELVKLEVSKHLDEWLG